MRYFLLSACLGLTACAAPSEVTQIKYITYQQTPVRVTVIETGSMRRFDISRESGRCDQIFQKNSDAAKIEKRIREDLLNVGVSQQQIEAEVAEMRSKVCG